MRVGQKVVCIKNGVWIRHISVINKPHPKYKETGTVREVITQNGQSFISLMEYDSDSLYGSHNFRPIEEIM